ncbi:MAG: ABC transporter ATP-binding protein [Burkholderiaceae bacterium]|nr:ABC transporter ATP-binding protein [Burkholderiaceae bacterium]
MLEIKQLKAGYRGIEALKGVDIVVPEGEMVAIIGANGAGKSTLLNCMSGVVRATAGQIRFAGQDITRLPPHVIARAGLLHVPEGRQVLADMTVQENLMLGALARGTRKALYEIDKVVTLFPILAERMQQAAGTLSGGQQQMMAIGRALMGSPRVLLLDEPSLGLSPLLTHQVFDALLKLHRDGLTIVLVEQNARRALAATQRAYVLERGLIAQHGQSQQLLHDPSVIEHYLGTGESALVD